MERTYTTEELQAICTPRAVAVGYYWWDHGWLRWLVPNYSKVDADVYRSAHPAPYVLRRFKAAGGKFVLSLRGGMMNTPNSYERLWALELGLDLDFIQMRSVELPSRDTLIDLIAALKTLPKPLLIHCKSGADRTGLAVTLYRHLVRHEPMSRARRALSWKFAHFSLGKAGRVHLMLDAFEAAQAATGVDFETWVSTSYDPADF